MATAKVAPACKRSNRGSKPGERRGGRQKGTPNKLSGEVKDMILQALNEAHEEGAVAYLKSQASANPNAFLTLVGKLVGIQLTGPGTGGEHIVEVRRRIVRP